MSAESKAVASTSAAASSASSSSMSSAASPPARSAGAPPAKSVAAGGPGYGAILLRNQLKELSKNPPDGCSVGLADESNIYEWHCMMEGPAETDYSGGFFPCTLTFPKEYPNKPPVMRFTTPGFWHPNVYKDTGVVCISILHEAKEDKFNELEAMSEKWRPIIGIEAVLVSVLSLLSDPNFESPANIDASVQLRNDPKGYKKKIKDLVRKSQDAL